MLAPAEVERVYHASIAGGCHTTRPAMLYFSNTSELGHVYTRAEFDSLCDVAEKLDLAVYVDGARMASALTAADGDLTLEHLASRADAFTLGGTKAGMLFGEALVVSPRTARGRRAIERIPYLTKRSGHMTAKGRLMGIQYEAVFDPELRDAEGLLPYFTHAKRSNECAVMLANGLEAPVTSHMCVQPATSSSSGSIPIRPSASSKPAVPKSRPPRTPRGATESSCAL